jgi:hypothetical protein
LVKLSLSLSNEDVEFLDRYAAEHAVDSRSGVVQRAVSLLRAIELGDDYAAAWEEWQSGDAALWETAVGDALADSSD